MGLMPALALAAAVVMEPINAADIAAFFDSPDHPLPIVSVLVPQAVDAQDVDKLLAGDRPTVFQIANATGPDADRIKELFFQEMAVEYLNQVNFRRVPAGSAAARRLTDANVTKPLYVIADPGKSGADRLLILDEGRSFEAKRQQQGDAAVADPRSWSVTQRTLEGALYQKLGVSPTFLVSKTLSADDAQALAGGAAVQGAAMPSGWARIFFFPADPKQAVNVSRLRTLFGLEDFFFAGRVPGFESDLSKDSQIYRTLLSREPPSEPELWLINPVTHAMIKYASPLEELGHDDYLAWLADYGIEAPLKGALSAEAVAKSLSGTEAKKP